jgi:excisionase family DNA binding protein
MSEPVLNHHGTANVLPHQGASPIIESNERHSRGCSAAIVKRPGIEEHRMIERKTANHTDTVLLTFKEAMEFLRVSRSTIYRLMWSGQLRGHKVGSTWRFYEADLLAAVAAAPFEPAQTRAAHN